METPDIKAEMFLFGKMPVQISIWSLFETIKRARKYE